MSVEHASAFAALTRQKRELEQQLKKVKAELFEIEQTLLRWFESSGIQRITVDGVTVHLRVERWPFPRGGDKVAAVQALRDNGLGKLVSVGPKTQSLRSLVREWYENEQEPPSWFTTAFDIDERYKVGARSS